MNTRKIGIVGAGHVGSHCAFSMLLQGVCDEITFVDIDKPKAISQALDCMDTLSFLPNRTIVKSGEIQDLGNKDIIIICVGTIDNVSKDRLNELNYSLKIIKSFVPEIMKTGFNGYFIVITNPVDIITYYVQELSGLPYNRVIGTGTGLDSARLRRVLSVETGIDARSIQAFMLGEHGDSQVAAFSCASVNGKPLTSLLAEHPEKFQHIDFEVIEKKVAETGWDIYMGKNSTEFGIACTCTEIVKAIFHDDKKVMPCSAFLRGEYGAEGLYAGVPAVIGKNGIEYIIELPINEKEQEKLTRTFNILKAHIELGKKALED